MADLSLNAAAQVLGEHGHHMLAENVRGAQADIEALQEDHPLTALHTEFVEAHRGGASSNDIAQLLDDYLTARGYPTVLYD